MAEIETVYTATQAGLLPVAALVTLQRALQHTRALQTGIFDTPIVPTAWFVLMEGCAAFGSSLLLHVLVSGLYLLISLGSKENTDAGSISTQVVSSFQLSILLSAAMLAASSLHSMQRQASVDVVLIDWEKAKVCDKLSSAVKPIALQGSVPRGNNRIQPIILAVVITRRRSWERMARNKKRQ